MKVESSVLSDVEMFKEFWRQAVEYQKTQASGQAWKDFPQTLIETEIAARDHFKVVQDDEIVGYFSLAWQDAAIWDERESGDAIYLHRMCVNANKKGVRLAEIALHWALSLARENNKKFVRIDTWRESKRLVEYYQKIGYRLVGEKRIGDDPRLQPHYRNINLALFENAV